MATTTNETYSDLEQPRIIYVKPKKKGIIQRVKDWWNDRSYGEQLAMVVGIWTLDGVLWGSYFTKCYKDQQAVKIAQDAEQKGYLQGKMDAYKEIAQNPYQQIDLGFKRLEQQGKAKKF